MNALPDLLWRIERYYDAVPRSHARAERFGPLTLFVAGPGGWPLYARPTLDDPSPVTADDVAAVRRRQRELDVPEAFEWVDDLRPDLTEATEAAGLVPHAHPLMVLEWTHWSSQQPPDGITVRRLTADDPDLIAAYAVAAVGFGNPGTAVGAAGREEYEIERAHAEETGRGAYLAQRISDGRAVAFLAADADGPLAVGTHQPVGDSTEIVGVATLPAARRRGLGSVITAALVGDALERGARLVLLSASDDAVARVYARAGFRTVGTAMIAEPGP